MDWERERYVRIYKRDEPDWVLLDWRARALFWEVLRKMNTLGRLDLGKHGTRGLAVLIHWPLEVVDEVLESLLEDGCLRVEGNVLISPNYVAAQEAKASGALRQADYRERVRDRNVPSPPSDTPSPSSNAASTSSDARYGGCYTRNSKPSLAEPSQAEPSQTITVPQPPALAPTDAAPTEPLPAALEFSAEHEEAPYALQSADVAPGISSSRRTGQSKGTRLEASWKPSELFYGWASKELGLSGVEVDSHLAEFHDYWAGVPGQRGRKLDWEATFRNRLREVGRRRRPASQALPTARERFGGLIAEFEEQERKERAAR